MLLKHDEFVLSILFILCILLSGLLKFSLKQKNKKAVKRTVRVRFMLHLDFKIEKIGEDDA